MSDTVPIPEDIKKDIKKASLKYVTDVIPGITREKQGKGFIYLTPDKKRVKDAKIISRIEKLGIPPAWEHVWICPFDNGHLQATGRDEKGRKQYLYHEDWTKICQENKFNKIVFFSEVLPTIRTEVKAGMNEQGLSKRRVISTIIWLLEHTYIRIGNPEYAKENQSYGLTTLRNKHVDVSGETVTFEFRGKSGKFHEIEIHNPKIAKIIKKLDEIPGYELFHYLDDEGNKHLVYSEDVNEYLKTITGEDITAKDFRTWGGTTFAAEFLYDLGPFTSKTQANKNITQAVKQVSRHLGNTATVCRCYYIHPVVITSYQKDILIPHFKECAQIDGSKRKGLSHEEYSVATLLKSYAS